MSRGGGRVASIMPDIEAAPAMCTVWLPHMLHLTPITCIASHTTATIQCATVHRTYLVCTPPYVCAAAATCTHWKYTVVQRQLKQTQEASRGRFQFSRQSTVQKASQPRRYRSVQAMQPDDAARRCRSYGSYGSYGSCGRDGCLPSLP